MSKIFRAAAPLTSRITPVLGAVLVLIGLMASSQLHLAQVTAGSTVTTDKSDYAPGETVAITGRAGSRVNLGLLTFKRPTNDFRWAVPARPMEPANSSNSESAV